MHRCRNVQKVTGRRPSGDNVGVLLRGTKRDDVERGQVLAHKGSIKPHTRFEQKCTYYPKKKVDDTPVLQRIPSTILLPHNRRDGAVELPEGVEMVMPEITSDGHHIDSADSDGRRLTVAIREGGRTVGAGVVAKIIE